MDNPFIEQSQKHAIADLKGWQCSHDYYYYLIDYYSSYNNCHLISADDDLDAIAMHDMGPERMVQHHHHGEHREHRLHSREFRFFYIPIFC
jgi:hypothetical protein